MVSASQTILKCRSDVTGLTAVKTLQSNVTYVHPLTIKSRTNKQASCVDL